MATQMAEIRKKTDESNVNLEQQLMTRDEILTYVETHPDRETLIRLFIRLLNDEANTYPEIELDREITRIANLDNSLLRLELEHGIDSYLTSTGQARAKLDKAQDFIREQIALMTRLKNKHLSVRWLFQYFEITKLYLTGSITKVIEGNHYAHIDLEVRKKQVEEEKSRLLGVQNDISNAKLEKNAILEDASDKHRQKLEEADQRALTISQQAYADAQKLAEREVQKTREELRGEYRNIARARQEVFILEAKKKELLEKNPELIMSVREINGETDLRACYKQQLDHFVNLITTQTTWTGMNKQTLQLIPAFYEVLVILEKIAEEDGEEKARMIAARYLKIIETGLTGKSFNEDSRRCCIQMIESTIGTIALGILKISGFPQKFSKAFLLYQNPYKATGVTVEGIRGCVNFNEPNLVSMLAELQKN